MDEPFPNRQVAVHAVAHLEPGHRAAHLGDRPTVMLPRRRGNGLPVASPFAGTKIRYLG